VCPGYDRSLDRVFQDESAAVRIKVQKAKAKALIAREEREKAERAQRAVRKMQNAIGLPLLCPMVDQGIAFFMSQYAMGIDTPPMSSDAYNQYLDTYGFHPVVATSMTALGLAGVANIFMDSRLKKEATRWYLAALKLTNKALENQSEVRSDSTLLATMLLSIFESTNNDKSLIAWTNHVAGSASLLRMRGKAQLATPAGRRMYMQCVGLLTIKCMGMGIALPRFIHDLNMEILAWEDENDPSMKFFYLHIDAIDFRAQILTGELTDLHQILDRALQIDEMAKDVFDPSSQDWAYLEERCDEGTPGVFGTSYHIYPHLAAAQTWNWVRYNRIYILDIIRNTLIAGLSTTPPEFVGPKYTRLLEESTEALYKMQSDIIASIPQYLHDTPKFPSTGGGSYPQPCAPFAATARDLPSPYTIQSTLSPPPTSALSPLSHKRFTNNFLDRGPPKQSTLFASTTASLAPEAYLPVVRVSGGYSALWGLYIAGTTPVATPATQAFVLHSLSRVANEFGINQAKVLAGALRTKIGLERGGIAEEAELEVLRDREGGAERRYKGHGGDERVSLKNAALRGGERFVVPIYMPRVGPHVEDET